MGGDLREILPRSAAVELLFSTGGDILRSKRASLIATNFEPLVLMKGNLGLLGLPKGPTWVEEVAED